MPLYSKDNKKELPEIEIPIEILNRIKLTISALKKPIILTHPLISYYNKMISSELYLEIVNELSKIGINIISGLARGIDTYAHLGTIIAKRRTIAVLGSGLDKIYPSENKKICEEIIKNDGAIITEFPLGTKPEKINFPIRNRIISGLSNGILVIEAKEKSGTLITVEYGLEQGKNIFVVPREYNKQIFEWN